MATPSLAIDISSSEEEAGPHTSRVSDGLARASFVHANLPRFADADTHHRDPSLAFNLSLVRRPSIKRTGGPGGSVFLLLDCCRGRHCKKRPAVLDISQDLKAARIFNREPTWRSKARIRGEYRALGYKTFLLWRGSVKLTSLEKRRVPIGPMHADGPI